MWVGERGSGRVGAAALAEVDPPIVLMVREAVRREVYLEITDALSGDRVVTVIEILSPSNKHPGPGRDLYLRKQADILASTASLVEIDLLRAGDLTVALPQGHEPKSPYLVVVSPAAERARREMYPIGLRKRLPRIAVPLLPEDPPVALDVQARLGEADQKGELGRRIDYASPPVPPLGSEDKAWADDMIAALHRG